MTQKTIKIDYTKPVSYKLIKDGYKITKGIISASDGMPKSLELDIPSEVYNTDLEYSVNVNVNGAPIITTNQFTLPDNEICEAKTYCYALKGKDYKYISKENIRHYDNFTIVGNPNITANGIASNFSVSNRLQLVNMPTYKAGTINSFDFTFKIHTPETFTANGRLINDYNSYDNLKLEVKSDGIYFNYASSSTYIGNSTTPLDTNTDYWVKVLYSNGIMSIQYSTDDITYNVLDSQSINTNDIYISSSTMDIGARYYGDQNPECNWAGSIDLNETYIKVNGEYYWLPYNEVIEEVTRQFPGILDSSVTTDNWQQNQEYKLYQLKNQNNTDSLQLTENSITDTAQKYKQYIDQITIPVRDYKWYYFDQHNYTLIGDINYNKKTGIINNFSQDNYIHIQNILPEFNTFEMQIVFDYNRLPSTSATRLLGKNSQDIQCGLVLGINSGNGLTLWTSSNGNEWTASTSSSYAVSTNTKTYLKIIFENSTYTVLVSTDKINWTTYISLNDNKFIQSQPFDIGSYLNNYLIGNIYINECYIKLDGTLWWDPFYLNEWLTNKSYYTYNVNTDYSDTLDFSESYIGVTQNQYHKYVNQNVCLMPINGGETIYIPNGDLIGGVTFDKTTGVLSNFSTSSYVTLPAIFDPSNNSWEMIFKFNSGTIGTSKGIFAIDTYYSLVLGFKNKLCIWTSSDGSTWSSPDMDDNGLTTLSNNTDYYVKATYSNNTLTVYLSTDKTTWTTEYTQSISLAAVSSNFSKLGLYRAGGSPLDTGSIDLKECQIKINNQIWWNGIADTKSNAYLLDPNAENGNWVLLGCLAAGATDDGTAQDWDVYYPTGYTQPILVPAGDTYSDGTKVDTITLPEHRVWNYVDHNWQKITYVDVSNSEYTFENGELILTKYTGNEINISLPNPVI